MTQFLAKKKKKSDRDDKNWAENPSKPPNHFNSLVE